MADPVKPLNRLKPFIRINNESSIPLDDEAPDGDGVACGCHTPDEFAGDFQKKFKRFLEDNLKVVGPLIKFLDDLKKVSQTAADILNTAKAAAATAAAALAALGASLGTPVGSLIAFITTLASAAAVITNFINDVVTVIDDAIREFLERIGEELAKRAIRMIPQWVPVNKGASNLRITSDQIKDVEGIVTRSYGDPIEPPFFQWHRWLNWSIQVQPEPRYKNVVVNGFTLNTVGKKSTETSIIRNGTFEIQWDAGALWLDSTLPPNSPVHVEGSFKDFEIPEIDGPFTSSVSPERVDPKKRIPSDWMWPTTGMYVWASGRWVYDCSRTDKLTGANPKMCSMMTPPRAMATASWEAVQFADNLPGDPADTQKTRVPAIRFMFFTCKRGGYLSYDSISDEDYEFILDLPPIDSPVSPFPIGHTPDFPHNTIVLRPRLLRDLQPLSGLAGARLIKPIITTLPPPADKPGSAPQQVKVLIRGKDIGNASAAGFILSLGWFDPNRVRAATVKDCVVKFSQFQGRLQVDRDSPVNLVKGRFQKEIQAMKKKIQDSIAKIKIRLPIPPFTAVTLDDLLNSKIPGASIIGKLLRDAVDRAVNAAVDGVINTLANLVAGTQSEEWLLRVGVNGRWQTRFFGDVKKGVNTISDPYEFKISLGPDDLLFMASNGIEFNPVGDMMLAGRTDRLLKRKRDSRVLTWNDITSAQGQDHEDIVFSYALDILVGNSATGLLAFGIDNSPLGLIEPGDFAKPGNDPATSNPLSIRNAQPGTVPLLSVQLAKFAEATSAIPADSGQGSSDEPILVEDSAVNDYRFTATLVIQNQIPK